MLPKGDVVLPGHDVRLWDGLHLAGCKEFLPFVVYPIPGQQTISFVTDASCR